MFGGGHHIDKLCLVGCIILINMSDGIQNTDKSMSGGDWDV